MAEKPYNPYVPTRREGTDALLYLAPDIYSALAYSNKKLLDQQIIPAVSAGYNSMTPGWVSEVQPHLSASVDPGVASASRAGDKMYAALGKSALNAANAAKGPRSLYVNLNPVEQKASEIGTAAYKKIGNALIENAGRANQNAFNAELRRAQAGNVPGEMFTAAWNGLKSMLPDSQEVQTQEPAMPVVNMNRGGREVYASMNLPGGGPTFMPTASATPRVQIPTQHISEPSLNKGNARQELERLLEEYQPLPEQKFIASDTPKIGAFLKLVDTWTGSQFSRDYRDPIDKAMQREYLKAQLEYAANQKSDSARRAHEDRLKLLAELEGKDASWEMDLRKMAHDAEMQGAALNVQQRGQDLQKRSQDLDRAASMQNARLSMMSKPSVTPKDPIPEMVESLTRGVSPVISAQAVPIFTRAALELQITNPNASPGSLMFAGLEAVRKAGNVGK